MSGYLVGSPAFKAGGTGDPRPAGSIPVHLRHICPAQGAVLDLQSAVWSRISEQCIPSSGSVLVVSGQDVGVDGERDAHVAVPEAVQSDGR